MRLRRESLQTFFDFRSKNLSLICDITCDLGSCNNLLPIYEKTTTWRDPILSIADKLELIALDNLPSLLPKASSLDFSHNLTPLLLSLENKTWQRCKQHFERKLKAILNCKNEKKSHTC